MQSHDAGGESKIATTTIPIAILCGAISVIDGFDTQAIGFAAGAITKEWNLPESSAGTFFSAGYVGAIIGAVVAGYAYRLLGYRRVLCFWLCWVSAGSVLNALAFDYVSLVSIRALCGIGLGAIIPILLAITAEFSSESTRGRALSSVVAGSPIGGVLAGSAYGLVSIDLGWRSIFLIGAVLPLVMIPLVLAIMPRTSSEAAAAQDGSSTGDAGGKVKGALVQTMRAVASMFTGGRAFGSIAIIIATFAGTLLALTLVSWTPLLLQGLSLSQVNSAAGGVAFNVGAMVSIFGFAIVLDRVRSGWTVPSSFAIAFLLLLVSGFLPMGVGARIALMAMIGFFAVGPQFGIWYLISAAYSGAERVDATAVSLIAARIGGVLGPIAVGMLVDVGMGSGAVYGALSVVPAVASVCVVLFLLKSHLKLSGT